MQGVAGTNSSHLFCGLGETAQEEVVKAELAVWEQRKLICRVEPAAQRLQNGTATPAEVVLEGLLLCHTVQPTCYAFGRSEQSDISVVPRCCACLRALCDTAEEVLKGR